MQAGGALYAKCGFTAIQSSAQPALPGALLLGALPRPVQNSHPLPQIATALLMLKGTPSQLQPLACQKHCKLLVCSLNNVPASWLMDSAAQGGPLKQDHAVMLRVLA